MIIVVKRVHPTEASWSRMGGDVYQKPDGALHVFDTGKDHLVEVTDAVMVKEASDDV